jgi:hypothetical protein
MIRDIVRTACVIAAMAVAASLIVEVRFQLTTLDLVHRQAVQPMATLPVPHPQPAPAPQPGRLRAVGRAILDLADAGLGVVR